MIVLSLRKISKPYSFEKGEERAEKRDFFEINTNLLTFKKPNIWLNCRFSVSNLSSLYSNLCMVLKGK